MNISDHIGPTPIKGSEDFVTEMKKLGYDIELHYGVAENNLSLMLAMARRIDKLERLR